MTEAHEPPLVPGRPADEPFQLTWLRDAPPERPNGGATVYVKPPVNVTDSWFRRAPNGGTVYVDDDPGDSAR